MAWSGSIDGTADGDPRAAYYAVRVYAIAGGVKVVITPHDELRGTYFAVWINGVWQGPSNYRAEISGDIEAIFPVDNPGLTDIWVEQVGAAETFPPEYIPSAFAEMIDALSAANLRIRWGDRYAAGVSSYKNTPVKGDTQLTSIIVTGAKRNINVEPVAEFNTRGRLYYVINSIGGVNFIFWWANGKVVAAGSIAGDGAVICAPENSSGLTITCVLTYTGDVDNGTAWLDVRWPALYQIHYSTAALTYPRTPEATMQDNGGTAYLFLTPALTSGNYNYNVLSVDDDGNVETAPPVPSDSPVSIIAVPKSPSNVTVGVSAGTPTVNWVIGEAGCTYTVYYSDANSPINFDPLSTPAPDGPTAVDATNRVLPGIAYPPVDNTADYTTVVSAVDAVAVALNTAFAIGEAGFLATLDTQAAAVDAAIKAYGVALKKRLQLLIDAHDSAYQNFRVLVVLENGAGLSAGDWTEIIQYTYGQYLIVLSSLIDAHPNHYTYPDGTLPGTRPDGTLGSIDINADNLLAAGLPFVKPGLFYFIVRAKKGGVEEQGDAIVIVELDSATSTGIPGRPNRADIQSIDSFVGLAIALTAGVVEVDAAAPATSIELLVNGASVVTVALPVTSNNYHQAQLAYTFAGVGWYEIAVRAIAASGATSATWTPQQQYIGGNATGAVAGLSAQAIRGRGI